MGEGESEVEMYCMREELKKEKRTFKKILQDIYGNTGDVATVPGITTSLICGPRQD